MAAGATPRGDDGQLPARHAVDCTQTGVHRLLGEVALRLVRLSDTGFVVRGGVRLDKGERVALRLSGLGQVEAFVTWTSGERTGFQFERPLRPDEMDRVLRALGDEAGPQS